jgi:type II secretory pathway pseudopilin PulG
MTSRTQKIIIGLAVVLLVGLTVIGFLLGAVVYGWKAAQRAGNEAATIQNLKTIAAVETQYFNTHNRTFGTFDQMVKEQMLSSKFAGNPVIPDGYRLSLTLNAKTANLASSYSVSADPRDESSGQRHFYLDSGSGQIHVNEHEPAGPEDPVL